MKIEICFWKTCQEKFSKYIFDRVETDVKKFDLKNIKLEKAACMWMCSKWPNVKIDWEAINYANWALIAERYKWQIYNKKNLLKEIEQQKKNFNTK